MATATARFSSTTAERLTAVRPSYRDAMRGQSVSSARGARACSAAIAAWSPYSPGRSSAVVVHAGVAPGVAQQHQREQPACLGLVRHQLEQHAAEADRLVAQLAPDQQVRTRREVALVEDQVERCQHRAQPVRQMVVLRNLVADARRLDLALGPHEPLLHRRLTREEGARHLRSGEPAQGSQGERDARLGGERGVAAGEEQPQPVVWDRAHGLVGLLAAAQRLQLAQLLRVAPLAAQAVDRAVARGAHDPAAGIGRDSVARPALDRSGERLLHRLLGEVEVAEDPDQGCDRPPRLAPEQAVDYRAWSR
jgi:hypothetical protein